MGIRRLCLAVVIGGAYYFCLESVFLSCRFFQHESAQGSVLSAGLFSLSYRHDECVKFSDIPDGWRGFYAFTASSKAAQGFGVIAVIFGGIACLFTVFGSCFLSFFPNSKRLWRSVVAGSLLTACFCQCFTFLFLVQIHDQLDCKSEEHSCTLGFGGRCSIAAACLYFVAGVYVLVFAVKPPKDNAGTTYLANLGMKLMHYMGISFRHKAWTHIRYPDMGLLVVSLVLFLFSLCVILDCHFYTVNFNYDTRQYSEGILFYHYYPDNSCRAFERGDIESFTSASKAGGAFAIIATILGGLLMLFLWGMVWIVNYPIWVYKNVLPTLAFFAGCSQAFTFLSNQERNDILCNEEIEDQNCEMGWNGYLAAVTVCLYILFIPALMWYGRNPNILLPEDQDDDAKQLENSDVPQDEGPEKEPLQIAPTDTEHPVEADAEVEVEAEKDQ